MTNSRACHVHVLILKHQDACIVGFSHLFYTPAIAMDFEEYVGAEAFYAIWQTIAQHMSGQNLASIRAVCRVSRKAVDDAVTTITVPNDTVHVTLPEKERFPACKQYIFTDPSENFPKYVRQYCGPPSNQTSVLVCGEACWKASYFQKWLHCYRDELSWVGLALCLCEEHQAEDLSAYLQRILAIGSGIQLTLLGLWVEVRGFPPALLSFLPSLGT